MSATPNPFAAPQSEPAPMVLEAPEIGGRMPASVWVAVLGVGLYLAFNTLLLVGWILGRAGPIELLVGGIPWLIGVLVFVGLVRRNRLAWQWGRIVVLLGAVLSTFSMIALFSFILIPRSLAPIMNDCSNFFETTCDFLKRLSLF